MSENGLKFVEKRVAQYIHDISIRESDVMRRLRDQTRLHPNRRMATGSEQTQFLSVLVEIMGANRIIEIGTFTGVATLAFAGAIPSSGRVVTLEIDPSCAAVGRPFWTEAGVADRIDVRIGSAVDTLKEIGKSNEMFDLAYIDGNKEDYDNYYELCMPIVKPGGVIAIDNVLWDGTAADPNDDRSTMLRFLNRKILNDERVSISMLPVGDGLTLARKR